MLIRRVDVMWLNDTRFTEGMMDAYLPLLQAGLPNSRIFQFPTKYIHTGSRCQSFNRMGGAICIITHQWHGYVTAHAPDPTGSGLINSVDIKAGSYHLRLINGYLVPAAALHGPATIHSRLTSYIQGSKAPK